MDRPETSVNPRRDPLIDLMHAVAAHYEMAITPFMAPLAENLLGLLPDSGRYDRALDLGTGTGILPRLLLGMGKARQAIGVDLSASLLRTAPAQPSALIHADTHALPFAPARFDLVTAHFGLNQTAPRKALRMISRALTPGGTLLIQEWAAEEPLRSALLEAAHDYAVMNGIVPTIALIESPWEAQIQTLDDYHEALETAGFTVSAAHEHAPVAVQTTRSAFLDFQLTWLNARFFGPRPTPDQTEPLRAALENALPQADLVWGPSLFQVIAHKRG